MDIIIISNLLHSLHNLAYTVLEILPLSVLKFRKLHVQYLHFLRSPTRVACLQHETQVTQYHFPYLYAWGRFWVCLQIRICL